MAVHKAIPTAPSSYKLAPEGLNLYAIAKIICTYSKSSGNPMYTLWWRLVATLHDTAPEGYGTIFDHMSINPADPKKIEWKFRELGHMISQTPRTIVYDDARPEFAANVTYDMAPAGDYEDALKASLDEDGGVQFWLIAPHLPEHLAVLDIAHEDDNQRKDENGVPLKREKIVRVLHASEWGNPAALQGLEVAPNGHLTLPEYTPLALESFPAP